MDSVFALETAPLRVEKPKGLEEPLVTCCCILDPSGITLQESKEGAMNGRRGPHKDGPWTVSFETITFEPPFASFLRGFFQEKCIVSCGTCKIAEVNSRADCVAETPLCSDTGLRIKVLTVRHRPNQAGVECRDMHHAQLGPRRQEP